MYKKPLTKDEAYIGNFLIDIYVNIEEHREIYNELPITVAVDKHHYALLKSYGFSNWLNKETMTLINGVQVIEEPNWTGTFMSMRGSRYKRVK